TVVAPTPGDAERWLSDLAHLADAGTALYPQREALGEGDPHYEIAGERAETLEALLQGRLRILVTTARAAAERTLVPAALEQLRLRLRTGERTPPARVVQVLERMGYHRVATVTEVAEFSIRGGILDVYGFGMAVPARFEWWGDDISSIRGFDLTTQRSLEELEEVTVLPITTEGVRSEEARPGRAGPGTATSNPVRRTLLELLPSDTLVLEEAFGPDLDEVVRAWNEAEHHLDVARRLGEDVPSRDAILEAPESWRGRIENFPRLLLRDERVDVQFGFFPPERIDRDLNRLRALLAGSPPTLILCDNEGQLERMEELLENGARFRTGASLAIGALDGGFVMPSLRVLTDHEIIRRARRLRRPRRYRQAAPSAATGALTEGDYVVHLDHGIGVYRGIETITAGESTIEVAIVEYEGGDRLNVPL
ncbi:MAG: CarD family transcriptional regulator, partial [Actinomycetota bacterium]